MSEANGGKVEYLLEADYSELDSDLEKANKKVEKATEESAGKTVRIEKEKTQDIKKEFSKVENSAEKTADATEKAWKESADDISDSFEKTSDDIDASTKNTGSVFQNVSGIIKSSLSEAAEGTVPLLGKIGELTEGLTVTQAAAIGIGAAFAGVAVLSVGVADDMQSAMNGYLAETGKSVDETERYQGILEDIYANNYGESFEDIANSMATVTKNLGELDDTDLQNITESAFALRDTFEYDITESTRAAKAMMDNFGVSGEEAMGLIAAGAQNGLDYSGELLDSISEYSVQFKKMGLSADDMFNIFQKGAESGAFNLDKVGDAVKEMSIRVVDGSDTTREGFKLLGLDADEMAEKFAAGGETAKEAFNQTLEALAAMEDPIAQNTAGVDLMGTMWEDLGPEAVEALAGIEEGSYNAADAMNQIKEVKYDDLGAMLVDLKRNVELLVIPIGEALIPLLSMLISSVIPILTGLLGPLIQLFAELLTPIITVISAGIQPLIDILNLLISNAINPLISVISAVLVPLFSGSLESMFSTASSVIGNIRAVFQNLIDFIKNVFTGNWSGAWNNIKNIFSNAISGLASIFKAPMNAIVDGWNKLASSIGRVSAPEWVPIVGGKSFSLPKMCRLKIGMDYVPSDMYPALLDEGEWVLTKEEANLLRSLGGIDNLRALMQAPEPEMGTTMRQVIEKEIIIHTHVDLDGKEVGNSVTRYVDRNMSDDEELRRRGN